MSSEQQAAYSMASLPADERPRERLHRLGSEAMSTAELIAIVLGSGMKGCSVLQLANQVVSRFGSLPALAEATIAELCSIKGLGKAKAVQLKAAFSLGERISRQSTRPKYRIENPLHVYNLVKDELANEKKEWFVVILLDVKGFVITQEVVAIGTLSETLVHPREVFYPAIRHCAASMILVHNHPSGDPSPSKEDYAITDTLVKVGALMSIPVRDHIIVGKERYVSFKQEGFSFTPSEPFSAHF